MVVNPDVVDAYTSKKMENTQKMQINNLLKTIRILYIKISARSSAFFTFSLPWGEAPNPAFHQLRYCWYRYLMICLKTNNKLTPMLPVVFSEILIFSVLLATP